MKKEEDEDNDKFLRENGNQLVQEFLADLKLAASIFRRMWKDSEEYPK